MASITEKDVEDFLQACQDDYEQKALLQFEQVNSLGDLDELHQKVKSDILNSFRAAWISKYGSDGIPFDLGFKVSNHLDKAFEIYRDLFNSTVTNGAKTEKKNLSKDYAIGIDLGTTMCCVAVVLKGQVEIIPNLPQNCARTTPSYVQFQPDGKDTFGHVAKQTAFKYPDRTVYDAKRMIGRPWKDAQLQTDRLKWPFTIIEENGNPKVQIGDRPRYPHEISARLLTRFRVMADEFLDLPRGTVKKAVITVPAYFSEPQRRATKEAGICAGLEVLNILSEPTAAAIAYTYDPRSTGNRKVLIYDLGGGTFDVSIGQVNGSNVEILVVHGDNHLGGEDFDQLLMDHCIQQFKTETGLDLMDGRNSEDKRIRAGALSSLARLRAECSKAKEWLSNTDIVSIDIPAIKNGVDLSIDVSRDKLDELCKPLVQKTLEIVNESIMDARTKGIQGKEEIDDVILIGGSTKMRLVETMVQEYFNGKKLCKHINPDEAVAKGAAIQADAIIKQDGRTFGDVTPFTLGIECLGDAFQRLIPRNTRIPCEIEQIFNTSENNQTSMRITALQGENDKASENIKLGEFYFNGIPPAPATQEKIKVCMEINPMGILQVKAISLTSGMEDKITVTSNQLGMNTYEITRLTEELRDVSISPAMANAIPV